MFLLLNWKDSSNQHKDVEVALCENDFKSYWILVQVLGGSLREAGSIQGGGGQGEGAVSKSPIICRLIVPYIDVKMQKAIQSVTQIPKRNWWGLPMSPRELTLCPGQHTWVRISNYLFSFIDLRWAIHLVQPALNGGWSGESPPGCGACLISLLPWSFPHERCHWHFGEGSSL